jgi:hypothetical protein
MRLGEPDPARTSGRELAKPGLAQGGAPNPLALPCIALPCLSRARCWANAPRASGFGVIRGGGVGVWARAAPRVPLTD